MRFHVVQKYLLQCFCAGKSCARLEIHSTDDYNDIYSLKCDSVFIFTACKRSLRRLCFHRCLSVHKGGLPLVWGGVSATPPWADTNPCADPPQADPPRQTPPQADTPLADTPLLVHAGIHTRLPVHAEIHNPPPAQCMLGYGQQAGGTDPTGMHSYLIFYSCFTVKTRNYCFQFRLSPQITSKRIISCYVRPHFYLYLLQACHKQSNMST